jgi:hypothetical protein
MKPTLPCDFMSLRENGWSVFSRKLVGLRHEMEAGGHTLSSTHMSAALQQYLIFDIPPADFGEP